MSAFVTGHLPEGEEPLTNVSPEQYEKLRNAGKLNWKEALVPVRLMVELPFWLLIPDCELSISFDRSIVRSEIRGHYAEITSTATYLNSRRNFVWMGPESDLMDLERFETIIRGVGQPVVHPLKTVVVFHAAALPDAITATGDNVAGRINNANSYFKTLCFAHIPLLNKIIRAYRHASHDPFAFEVSEWDVPLWWTAADDRWVRISLMNYWDADQYPSVREWPHGKPNNFFAATPNAVQKFADESVPVGKLELLDALSLFFRGRFGDAVRSAVTAIEMALEAQLSSLLEEKGLDDAHVRARLDETRNSFPKRLDDYELLSNRRLPGPLLSFVPYINGIRLKNELAMVRALRHEVVHEGVRVDIFARGPMLRVVETMRWLFDWLSSDDVHAFENDPFFTAVRGMISLNFAYGETGVIVLMPAEESPDYDTTEIRTTEELLFEQYIKTIDSESCDIDLFTIMSLNYLGLTPLDGPPRIVGNPIPRERYLVQHHSHRALIFCLELDKFIELSHLASISLRQIAHARSEGPGWSILCIVTHQRQLPAEARETVDSVSRDAAMVAEECGITLITSNDLMSLVRGVIENGWSAALIIDLLFTPGRQGLVPPTYQCVGTIRQIFDKLSVIRLRLTAGVSIKLGDTLAVRVTNRYREQPIISIHVENHAVDDAIGPCDVHLKTSFLRSELIRGQDVYVRSQQT